LPVVLASTESLGFEFLGTDNLNILTYFTIFYLQFVERSHSSSIDGTPMNSRREMTFPLLANSIGSSGNRRGNNISDWLMVISGSRRLKHGMEVVGVENAIFNIEILTILCA
jgi:hypothetical protein